MASRSFRGPTIKVRVIGTGLSIQGPFEPLNQAIDRAFEIRRGLRLHRVCRVAARGEDGLRLAGRDRFCLLEDLRVPSLGLTSQRLARKRDSKEEMSRAQRINSNRSFSHLPPVKSGFG